MEIDKTIEVMKAAMEKEMKAKNSNECMDEKIDIEEAFEETSKETISKATASEDSRMINNHQEDMVLDEASKEDNQNIPSKDDINGEDKSEDKPAKSGKSFLKSSITLALKLKVIQSEKQGKYSSLKPLLLRTYLHRLSLTSSLWWLSPMKR